MGHCDQKPAKVENVWESSTQHAGPAANSKHQKMEERTVK